MLKEKIASFDKKQQDLNDNLAQKKKALEWKTKQLQKMVEDKFREHHLEAVAKEVWRDFLNLGSSSIDQEI